MNQLSWYEKLERGSNDITQGDIVFGCQALKPIASFPKTENTEIEAELTEYDGIIITQACDIAQSHVDMITMCPIVSITSLRDELGWSSSETKSQIGLIAKNQMPAYFLLNEYKDGETTLMEYRVVDFKNIFSVPLDILRITAAGNEMRFRLKSPYKESLSQAFARFFMRVGLPSSIEKDKLKAYLEQL